MFHYLIENDNSYESFEQLNTYNARITRLDICHT